MMDNYLLSDVQLLDEDGFLYPDSEYLDYCQFLDCWLNMHDGGIDDDL